MKLPVRIGLLVAVIPAIGLLASPAPASTNTPIAHAPFLGFASGSINWSGYAADGSTFNSVSASWVQPTGTCTGKETFSAFWVGLDGDSSDTVEQTGSEVDCRGGTPHYYAWYEMYPAYPVNFANAVIPGDHFTASVTASGDNFTLKISDTTEGWSHTVHKSLSSAKKSSAEVIAEAPCCQSNGNILNLTDFGTVNFSNAMANGAPLGNSHPTKINMIASCQGGTCGSNKDKTSALTGGENFSDTFISN
jgi:hypothetical protein